MVLHEATSVGTHPVWIDHGVNPYKSSFQAMSERRVNGGRTVGASATRAKEATKKIGGAAGSLSQPFRLLDTLLL